MTCPTKLEQLYRCLTTRCESSANKHHMEEQKSVFNLKLSNCLGFRWKDLPSITEMAVLLLSFRCPTSGSCCSKKQFVTCPFCHLLEPLSIQWLFMVLWQRWLEMGIHYHTKDMLETSIRQGDRFTLSNHTSSQLYQALRAAWQRRGT